MKMNTGFVSLTNRCWDQKLNVYDPTAVMGLDLLVVVSS